MLSPLRGLENPPWILAVKAYEWCPLVWERGWTEADIFLLPLEIGLRHLDPSKPLEWQEEDTVDPHHIKYSKELLKMVFTSGDYQAIADLLQALTIKSRGLDSYTVLRRCTSHIVSLDKSEISSLQRLRRLVIRSVEVTGYEEFKGAEPGRFIELLNHLRVSTKDVDSPHEWVSMLVKTIQTPEEIPPLDLHVWQFLHSITTLEGRQLWFEYKPEVMSSLRDAGEWGKLECWLVFVWNLRFSIGGGDIQTGELENSTRSLFQHGHGARLRQRVVEWSGVTGVPLPASFEDPISTQCKARTFQASCTV